MPLGIQAGGHAGRQEASKSKVLLSQGRATHAGMIESMQPQRPPRLPTFAWARLLPP